VADLIGEIRGHRVDRIGKILPRAGDAADVGLSAEFPFGADFAGDARDFAGEGAELIDHGVDGVFQLQNFAARIDGDFALEISLRDDTRLFGYVADLIGEVRRHPVHGFRQVAPRTGDAADVGLTTEAAVGADFASDARHFTGEGVKLIHHRVDGV